MKVLMIGTERRLFIEGDQSAKRIAKYGSLVKELHIIAFTPKGFKEKTISNNIYLYPTNSISKAFYILDALEILKKLKSLKIDLVSSQDPFESGIASYLASRKLKAKLQLQIHTDFLNSYFKSESLLNYLRVKAALLLLPKADCLRVVSSRIKESIKEAGVNLKSEPTILPVIVGMNFNISGENVNFLVEKYPRFRKFILVVSRIEREKDISLGIKAFAHIAPSHKDTALVIVGEGSLKEKLKGESLKLGISDQVFFEGWVQDLYKYYKSASLFLSTSKYEGYGVSMVEAAILGLPVISSDAGIASEFFKDTEMIFPVGNKKLLVEKLELVLNDVEKAKERAAVLSEKVRASVLDKKRYFELYKIAWEKCLC